MAEDGIKISGLNEVLTEPATGEMVASVVGGVTYKRNIGSRLPSTTQKSALAGYGGTPSGTNPYATQAAVKPLSDLSRVMRINGDGVPIFPDNVAGIGYKNITFSDTDSWASTNGTISAINGVLSTAYVSGASFNLNRSITATSGKLVVLQLSKSGTISSVDFEYRIGGSYYYIMNIPITDILSTIPLYIPTAGNIDYIAIRGNGPVSGVKINLKGIYIGSGLYDTPVYGKDGQTVAVNHGAVPVNGPRGKGLLFQGKGAMPLVFNGPVIGLTGTIRFKFKTSDTLIGGFYFGNTASSAGLALYQNDGGATDLKGFSIGGIAVNTEYTFSFYFSLTSLYVYRNGALLFEYILATPLTISPSNLYIGRNSESASGQDFTLYDFEYVAEAETLDAHIRYHNGDDAVDSQQKSATGTPNAIATYANDGFLGEHGTFTPVLSFGGNSVGITYEYRSGVFNRIGKMCFCSIRMNLSSKGSSTGDCRISGLPFSANDNYSITVGRQYAITYSGQLAGITETSANIIDLIHFSDSGVPAPITNANFSDVSQTTISVVYFIN